jgi:cellulose synthase/poly-beta-1,6-N-acetylglucosamine synthase-like glycosyltransferase
MLREVKEFFYVLATIQILLGIFALVEGIKWLGMVSRRIAAAPAFYSPKTAVICACKGAEPELESNLMALGNFDYSGYEIFLTLASSSDPAYAIARRVAEHSKGKVHLVIAGKAPDCGEKVNNLRAAIDEIPPEFDLFVFVDSDGRPGRQWLKRMVGPLANSQIGAGTTMRWFFPTKGRMANALLTAWNAAIVTFLGEHKNNFCWGGGTAIRREVFEQAAVRDFWRGSVADDFSMTAAVKRSGRQIYFVPECLVPSPVDMDFDGVLEFTNRQMIITRIYSPRVWAQAAAAHLFYSLTMLLGFALVIAQIIEGLPMLQLAVIVLMPAILAMVRGVLRVLALAEIFPAMRQTILGQSWMVTFLAALVPFLFSYNFLVSAVTRKICWCGVRYELISAQQVKILPG